MCAIDDPVEEVRLTGLDELEKQKDDAVTAYFVGRMRNKHASNEVINRAGVALGRIKDPSCIATLIEYLVTGHYEMIPPSGGPGSMTNTFSKNGGGGGGMGMNQKPTASAPTWRIPACSTPWSRSPARISAMTSGRGPPGMRTRRPRAGR